MPQTILDAITAFELDAQNLGMKCETIDPAIVPAVAANPVPRIVAVSWDSAEPGAFMRYNALLSIPLHWIGALRITTYFGMGAFGLDARDAFQYRDPVWPVTTSEPIPSGPVLLTVVRLGHRNNAQLPLHGCHGLNFMLWHQPGGYQAAALLDRYHVHPFVNGPQ